jgi:hypothetical protein
MKRKVFLITPGNHKDLIEKDLFRRNEELCDQISQAISAVYYSAGNSQSEETKKVIQMCMHNGKLVEYRKLNNENC